MKKLIVPVLAALLLFCAVGAGVSPSAEATPTAAPTPSPTPTASPIPAELAAWEGSFGCVEPESMKAAVLQISREGESLRFALLAGEIVLARGAVTAGEDRGIELRGRELTGRPFAAALEPVADTLNYTMTVRLAADGGLFSRGSTLRLRRTGTPAGLEPFLGRFRADGDDNPAPADLTVAPDGGFALAIERLTEFSGWVDSVYPGAAMLSARDPNGDPIAFELTLRDGEYRLRVTDSVWMLLPAGETFRFAAEGEEPEETPTPAPAPTSAVPRGYEGFVGRYTSSRPGPAELEIRPDGSFRLEVQGLGEIRGAVSSVKEGFAVLTGQDAAGKSVTLEFGNKFDRYELRDGEDSRGLLPGGGVYDFEKERTPAPTSAPAATPVGEPSADESPAAETPASAEPAAAEPAISDGKSGGIPGGWIALFVLCALAAGIGVFVRNKKNNKR